MKIRLSAFADEMSASLEEQIEGLHKLGIRYMEVRGVDGRNITELSEDETKELKRRLDDGGIKVSAIGSPLGKISLRDDFEPHLALFDHVMKQAQILGTPYVRLFSFYDADGQKEEVKKRLSLFLSHTPEGITLLHENEKGIYGNNAARCLEIFQAFPDGKMRATFDPANFIQEHQNVLEAYEVLRPYISYVHIKDAKWDSGKVVPPGQGDAGFDRLLEALRNDRYEGFFSMEPHLFDFAGFHDLEKNGKASHEEGEADPKALFALAVSSLRRFLKEGEEA